MRNTEIASVFDELADRLALTDAKPYRYMAYRRAATTFRELADSAAVLSQEGRLLEIEGIGPAIDEKVRELLVSGTFAALERARADVDDTLLALTRLPGIGPATARKAHADLGGASFDSLLDRARIGSLEPVGGLTKKLVAALTDEAARRDAGGGDERAGELSGIPRDEQGELLPGPWLRRDQVQAMLTQSIELLPDCIEDPQPSGAYVRGVELLTDARLVATATDPDAAARVTSDALTARGWETSDAGVAALPELAGVDQVQALQVVSPAGVPVVIAITSSDARTLVQHRLVGPSAWVTHEPEPDASGVGVPWELRDRIVDGALAIADIPDDLVRNEDLRGELHAHSDWSDGRAPIIDMAHAARDRGDAYFAVTDHSAPYAMVGGLDEARLHAQADEIARVNEQLQREHEEDGAPAFRVLRGTELEILTDGTLGLSDAVLQRLDWVVASLHVQQRQSADVVRERMARVLENPLVDAIGHPTSRRLLARERTALDVDWLIEQSRDLDVVLEINANPDRLDLDSEHAAAAVAAGVRLTINTDAHRTSTLALREHGVAVARRGGVRRGSVVNCLDVQALLASRRRDR